jgi:hypothetical protein
VWLVLEQIAPIHIERPLIHPHQRSFQAACRNGRCIGCGNQVAATDVEFAIENKRYG